MALTTLYDLAAIFAISLAIFAPVVAIFYGERIDAYFTRRAAKRSMVEKTGGRPWSYRVNRILQASRPPPISAATNYKKL